MRVFTLLFFVFFAVVAINCAPEDGYSTKYDNFDVDTVLNNQRILKNYIKCILDKGPCTPEGKELRRNLQEIIETTCRKCNKNQRKSIRKMTLYFRDNRHDDWIKMLDKYDKTRKYEVSYNEFLNVQE